MSGRLSEIKKLFDGIIDIFEEEINGLHEEIDYLKNQISEMKVLLSERNVVVKDEVSEEKTEANGEIVEEEKLIDENPCQLENEEENQEENQEFVDDIFNSTNNGTSEEDAPAVDSKDDDSVGEVAHAGQKIDFVYEPDVFDEENSDEDENVTTKSNEPQMSAEEELEPWQKQVKSPSGDIIFEVLDNNDDFEPEPVERESLLGDLFSTPDSIAGRFGGEEFLWMTDNPGAPVDDVNDAFSLNDRYLLIRSLFDGNEEQFLLTLERINSCSTFNQALADCRLAFPEWNESSDEVYRFYMAVRRKFI